MYLLHCLAGRFSSHWHHLTSRFHEAQKDQMARAPVFILWDGPHPTEGCQHSSIIDISMTMNPCTININIYVVCTCIYIYMWFIWCWFALFIYYIYVWLCVGSTTANATAQALVTIAAWKSILPSKLHLAQAREVFLLCFTAKTHGILGCSIIITLTFQSSLIDPS